MIELLAKLLFAHAIGDFGLQSEIMAYGKNRHNKPKNVPVGQQPIPVWIWWLSAHALINGAMFYLLTGSIFIGILESVSHFIIDFAKTENLSTPTTDQIYHLITILFYLVLLI